MPRSVHQADEGFERHVLEHHRLIGVVARPQIIEMGADIALAAVNSLAFRAVLGHGFLLSG